MHVAGDAPTRHVLLIDDLLGAILLLAAAVLAVLLDLTRRQICAVYQLAFALCAASSFFVVGGLVDHHLSDDQLHLALYSSYLPASLTTSYIYLPILASLCVSLALLVSLSACACDCCCLVGGGASAASHQRCLAARIRAHASLYGVCFVWLYVAAGTRLNVRLRESAIHPVGGTLHWQMLRSPFYLTMAHIGSLLLVRLKVFLQHADGPHHHHPYTHSSSMRTAFPSPPRDPVKLSAATATSSAAASSTSQLSNPAMIEELMRPPPVKSFALAPRRAGGSGDTKQALPRSPQAAVSTKTAEPRASPRAVARRYSDNNNGAHRAASNDGDVSSLISSDSESDDGVLRPSFRPSTHTPTAKTLPPRHAASSAAAAVRKRPSGGSTSAYSSSPPPSPTHSTASSGSSSVFSSASRVRGAGSASSRPGSSSSARPRSSGSTSSTTFLSDTDDHLLSHTEAYGSSGAEGSYLSDTTRPTGGIRRRAPSLAAAAAMRRPSSLGESAAAAAASPVMHRAYAAVSASSTGGDWIECVDDVSGSAYYYNTRTGESRWKEL